MRIQKYNGSKFRQVDVDPTKIYQSSTWKSLNIIDPADYMASDGAHQNFYPRIMYPHALYNSGQNKTVMVYQNEDMNPTIIEYNHTSKSWSTAYVIGSNELSEEHDSHGGPVIYHDTSGYYHVFYGAHSFNTTGLKHTKSDSANDISSFTEQTLLAGDIEYPKIFKVADGTIYLFLEQEFSRSIYYKSTDECDTWSDAVTYCEFDYTYSHQEYGNIVYDDVNERFHKIFGCRYPDGDPNLDYGHNRNVYYMYMDIATERWYNSDGVRLKVDCEDETLVWGSGNYCNHYVVGDVHCQSGKVYAIAPSVDTTDCSSVSEILENVTVPRFIYFDGSGWTVTTPFPEHKNVSAVANMRVLGEDHLQVFLFYLRIDSSYDATHGGNVEEWEYYNGEWTYVRTVLSMSESTKFYGRSCIVKDGLEELMWFFDENHDTGGTATKIFAYGDRGFVS